MQLPSVFRSALLLSLLMLLLQGCDRWPADPRHSLDAAIERGTLKVGVVANPPWVSITHPDTPEGLESQLVTQFAQKLDMTVEWSTGGVEEQIEALKSFQLDLLIGGFTTSNPWKAEVGNKPLGLEDKIADALLREPDILDASSRLREEGHLVGGEIFVVLAPDQANVARRVQEIAEQACTLDWRLYDLIVMPVEKIER